MVDVFSLLRSPPDTPAVLLPQTAALGPSPKQLPPVFQLSIRVASHQTLQPLLTVLISFVSINHHCSTSSTAGQCSVRSRLENPLRAVISLRFIKLLSYAKTLPYYSKFSCTDIAILLNLEAWISRLKPGSPAPPAADSI